MKDLLLIIGVGLVAFSGVPYIKALLRHQVRPRLVSWVIWTVLAFILTLSAIGEGAIPSALLTSVTMVSCGAVVVLGWRQSSKAVSRFELVCLAGAVAGLAAYFLLGGLAALVVSVAIDAIAYIPTLVHGYTDPDEESLASYGYAASGEFLVMLVAVVSGSGFVGLVYPVYAVAFNGLMFGVLSYGRAVALSRRSYGIEELG